MNVSTSSTLSENTVVVLLGFSVVYPWVYVHRLFKFYFSAANLQYLETLVTVPTLTEVSPFSLLHYKTLMM